MNYVLVLLSQSELSPDPFVKMGKKRIYAGEGLSTLVMVMMAGSVMTGAAPGAGTSMRGHTSHVTLPDGES